LLTELWPAELRNVAARRQKHWPSRLRGGGHSRRAPMAPPQTVNTPKKRTRALHLAAEEVSSLICTSAAGEMLVLDHRMGARSKPHDPGACQRWRLAAFLLSGPCGCERTGVADVVPGGRDPAVGTLDVGDAEVVDMAVEGIGDAAWVPLKKQPRDAGLSARRLLHWKSIRTNLPATLTPRSVQGGQSRSLPQRSDSNRLRTTGIEMDPCRESSGLGATPSLRNSG
jgi:hypothetical protein